MKFGLQRVHFMPSELQPGVLYMSEEFGIAAHLCACGCGARINTPLGETEWSVEETPTGPSLNPSVGNWQEGCRSHYWIDGGEIRWAAQWTEAQISLGRRREEERRSKYYERLYRNRGGLLRRLWFYLKERLTPRTR
jgi:hypothetical protein